MTGAGQQPNKQIDSETQKLRNIQVEDILKKQKGILTNRRTSRLTVDTRTQRVKEKNEELGVLCSVVVEINKK